MDSEQKTNADEAIAIARRALSNGDLEKARKFCEKSVKLFPTNEAQTLLKEIDSRMNASKPSPKPTPSPKPSHTPSSSSSTPTPAPTNDETRTEALRIISSKGNYYEVLSITKTCTEQEIKTSFRRLALRFHPDKCTVKEGEEAMKIVNAAHECLKDPARRKRYDVLGTEDATQLHGRNTNERDDRENDLSTDDIINMFFNPHNNRGPRFTAHTFRRGPAFGGQQGGGGVAQMGFQFAHLVPFILIFVLSVIAAPSATDDQPFSLQRTEFYSIMRSTEGQNVPYYVSRNFAQRYQRDPRAVATVEQRVLKDFYEQLGAKCMQEKNEHKVLLAEAKKSKGNSQKEKLDRAHNFRMPSCDQLQSFSVR